MDSVYVAVVAGAVLAGFVQGLSGFGFSLVSMSLWAWTVDPQLAAVLAVFGGLTGQVIAAVSMRRGFDARLLWPFLAGGLVGIPAGVAILPMLEVHVFKAALGVLLAVWCPVMLLSRHLPAIRAGGAAANGVVGLIGGVMGGLGGFTGVIPTLWCTLRRFDKDVQRNIIQNFNLATLAFTMLGYVVSGAVTREMLPMFAVVAPAMLVPTLIGARLYLGISDAAFRRIVLTMLTLSGVALLASSIPTFFAG
ncbi:sulfite exporter TauE/SafE family protein [Bordetella genomosp. 13]|uniref:Probable membrane transporter protein n=1 Tax=Bordetella genomosp. 13 TaxID=463040 RepID=A0A1W6ZAV2_9BORD|nr:sulfite exporter TauE/SafE family protein [Bordetella genomosp. 13]ARP94449.1 permease [Bordetella genomosp. 13]